MRFGEEQMTAKPLSKAAPVLWLLLFLTSLRAFGQDVTGGLNIGFPENGDFSGSDFENVQINNGNLHIEIPLYSEKGRGLGVALKYVYDNKGWSYIEHCTKQGFCSAHIEMALGNHLQFPLVGPFGYGATYLAPVQMCGPISVQTFTNYVLTEPDGTRLLASPWYYAVRR
jgi:hypothetical protein